MVIIAAAAFSVLAALLGESRPSTIRCDEETAKRVVRSVQGLPDRQRDERLWQLVLGCEGISVSMVKRYGRGHREDLLQEARMALYEALRRYDPDHPHAKLFTLAWWAFLRRVEAPSAIVTGMNQELVQEIRRMRKWANEQEQKGRDPNLTEVFDAFEVPTRRRAQLATAWWALGGQGTTLYSDFPPSWQQTSDEALVEPTYDPRADMDDAILLASVPSLEALMVLAGLNETARTAIRMRLEEAPFAEIGEKTNKTKEGARQAWVNGMKKMETAAAQWSTVEGKARLIEDMQERGSTR